MSTKQHLTHSRGADRTHASALFTICVDLTSGKYEEFRFGPMAYVGEPVFVPQPGSQKEDAGWLLCEVLDGRTQHSALAVFDARAIPSGPIARVKLEHHLPFSFHGCWQPA